MMPTVLAVLALLAASVLPVTASLIDRELRAGPRAAVSQAWGTHT
jgi:hypothetical protein